MATEHLDYSDFPMTTATANTTYVLDSDGSYNSTGIMIDLAATQGLKFQLNGSLYAKGTLFEYGTLGQIAPSIEINVGQSAYLQSGYNGFVIAGDGSLFHNEGTVVAVGYGFEMHGDGLRAINSGTIISGDNYGVQLDGGDLRLDNSGLIKGTVEMYSDAGTHSTLINTGRLESASWAVVAGAGDDTLINRGHIRSNIQMGTGDDRFIDKGGHVSGSIHGGAGDDLYVIKSTGYDLRESAGAGFDTVKSSVSWTLDQQFEVGRLTGARNINLAGLYGDESLYGNVGNNKLSGDSGMDRLNGGRGDDALTGGADADTFIFSTHAGKDVITDFEDGMDLINLQSYDGMDAFADLKGQFKQSGNDLVITLLDGDQLTLRHTEKASITAADFEF